MGADLESVGLRGLGRKETRDQQPPVPERPGSQELPLRKTGHLVETEPPAFATSTHRAAGAAKEVMSLCSVSTKTETRVTGVYSKLGSLQNTFHSHCLTDSHHNPARCPSTAGETKAPKG